MTSMEQFTELKRKRDCYASIRWTATLPSVSLFQPDGGSRTREYAVTNGDLELFSAACSVVENEGSSDISFCASYELGNAVKKLVLRCIDKKLAQLAVDARDEAQAVLDQFSQ